MEAVYLANCEETDSCFKHDITIYHYTAQNVKCIHAPDSVP